MKILLVAGMEHTKGQDLLAREIAAFGYWTLNFYEQPHIQAEKFIKLIKKFHLPNVKDSESFVEEFDFHALAKRLQLRERAKRTAVWDTKTTSKVEFQCAETAVNHLAQDSFTLQFKS